LINNIREYGGKMTKLTQPELIALGGVLKLECGGLAFDRVMKTLIDDEDLRKQAEAGILQKEGRINAIKKFVETNVKDEVEGVI